jgi:hypothetical protein
LSFILLVTKHTRSLSFIAAYGEDVLMSGQIVAALLASKMPMEERPLPQQRDSTETWLCHCWHKTGDVAEEIAKAQI